MVFPLFAGLYYWAPLVGGRPLSERARALGVRPHVRGPQHRLSARCTLPDCSACRGACTPMLRGSAGTVSTGLYRRRLRARRGHPGRAGGRHAAPARGGQGRRERVECSQRSSGCPPTTTRCAVFRSSASRDPLWAAPGTGAGSRSRTAFPAVYRNGRARDNRHEPSRRRAAVPPAPAGLEFPAAHRRRRNGGVLPVPDRQDG